MAGTRSNFDFISSYCEPTFSVEKYQSNKTGMKLYHIKLPLPLIKLEICVQTKPYDDTGCPHTLEHLIFMGSKNYPQQGYLDHISAECFSLGTNATTYRDMTTYELTTVNSQSLSTLLPIYLDHVFNPLLTNDCYLTEVHHVSGETGDDAGVVYSEMQSSEKQADEILLYSIMRNLWSEKSPYYYESGGRLEAIRNELNLNKIRIFHRKFYVPKNVAIVLCGGGVNIDEILVLLDKFEQENFSYEKLSLINNSPFREHQRKKSKLNHSEQFPHIQIRHASFDDPSASVDTCSKTNSISLDTTKLSVQSNTTTTNDGNDTSFCDSELMVSRGDSSAPVSPVPVQPPVDHDQEMVTRQMNEYKEVFYPVEDDEENLGQVAFGYRLESIYEMEFYTALDVLLTTLFDEDISIFYKEFIEMPNMLCASVDHDWFNYPERVLTVTFEGVEIENLTMVADKYSSTLYAIINSDKYNDQLYAQILRNIRKKIQLHLNEIQNEPFDLLTDLCCLDHISELSIGRTNEHDDDEQRLHKFLRNKTHLEALLERPMAYWHELIRKYLLEWDASKRTIILLKPSHELLSEQQEQEEQRIAQRLKLLGPLGRAKLTSEVQQAKLNNQQSLAQCAAIEHPPVTFDNQLHIPPVEYYSAESQIDLFHSPTSHFIKYVLHIPMKELPVDLQPYLPLFTNLLFHTAIDYENVHLAKYAFCELVSRDVLDYSVSNGQSSSSPVQSSYVSGHYIDTFLISLQSMSNVDMYRNTIDYFRYVLFGSQLTDYNIIIEECEKQLKNLIETLQDGQTIHQAYFNSLLYASQPSQYYHRMNIFQQKSLLEKICKQPAKHQNDILAKLERIKGFLLKNLSQVHLTVCGDMKLIKDHWTFVEEFMSECKRKSQIDWDKTETKEKPVPAASPATIIGCAHEESGYVMRWARLPISHSDFVPLLILSNYLDMENGPLWNACRTNGYAYGVAFDFDFETNLILLSINQCSQLKLAYSSALSTLEDLLDQRLSLDAKRMNAARNLTICMLTEHVATLGRATSVCIRSYLNTYSIDKYQDLLNEVSRFEYSEAAMRKTMDTYLSPLVDNQQASTLILVNTSKMRETNEFLTKEHRMANVISIKDVMKHLAR